MPESIAHHSARILEYDQFRDWLSTFAQSELGRSRISALEPTTERAWIARQHQLTAEIRSFLRAGGRFDFVGLTNPGDLLDKARIRGAALEIPEIRSILFVSDKAAEWREISLHPPADLKSEWQAIRELSSRVGDFSELLRYFGNKLLPDGTLDDRASPELARIRRETEKQRRHIQHTLQAYLRRLAEGGAVQDELVTIRGERFVIPVKIEQKRRVPGVIHGTSSSGQTVFVEPMETIEQNNDLVRLLEEEQAEIHRILTEMTMRLGQSAPAIADSVDVLAELELQFAKARFAEQYDCAALKILDRDAPDLVVLQNARHPLLERNLRAKASHAVPMTLEMDRDHRQLIISGPNTGGKTVSLKTMGLLVMMGQAGIPVPADRAEFPLFDSVLADIGDYQSIEQNLSTFSAHVTNIDFISHTASERSLVLLDELGSATDPEEGAALAVAIADFFRRLRCVTIISTQHTSLKVYAANTSGVLNAAVGFDEQTLAPTYELRVGVPGASAGINVAQHIGLNPEIVSEARGRLSSQTQDIARFLDNLHSQLRQVESERQQLKLREERLAREQRRLETEGLKEQREKVRDLEKKLESLLRDFEYHAREAVNAISDRAAAQKLSKEAERRIARARREFREQFNQSIVAHSSGADQGDTDAQPHVVQRVQEGDTVQLKSLGRAGRITRKFDDQAVEVEVGMMKMRVPVDDIAQVIARVADNPVQAARARGITVSLRDDSSAPPSEINVIGFTVDDATREVEKFIDRAFLAGMSRVRIVHGSGMGILRKALRQYLNSNPQVANVTEPPQKEGGAGATVVELKV
ncbi:MAG TPA: endonuclease MutS2 [Terriglobales bacterium]|nr:endonuclease MutS2 [Terriglobales bacterium]